MRPALHRLLAGSIDYAGLFPPARLDLPEALANFHAYRQGPESWIINRFVIPASRLKEFAELLPPNTQEGFPLTVVGHLSTDRPSWEQARAEDVKDMNAFQSRFGDQAPIEAYEIRLPDNENFSSWINDLHGFRDAEVYAELRWDDGVLDAISAAAETEWVNLKARTGGEIAEAFPAASALAGFLQAVTQLDVPFKLTAGLHHPLPTPDLATGAAMHGFLNIFAGVALAKAGDLSMREWEAILMADSNDAFVFGDYSLTALGMEADLDAIEEARDLLVGFGSCSVTEPLEGLAHLGLDTH